MPTYTVEYSHSRRGTVDIPADDKDHAQDIFWDCYVGGEVEFPKPDREDWDTDVYEKRV